LERSRGLPRPNGSCLLHYLANLVYYIHGVFLGHQSVLAYQERLHVVVFCLHPLLLLPRLLLLLHLYGLLGNLLLDLALQLNHFGDQAFLRCVFKLLIGRRSVIFAFFKVSWCFSRLLIDHRVAFSARTGSLWMIIERI